MSKWFDSEDRMCLTGRWRLNGLFKAMRRLELLVDGEVMPILDYDYGLDAETGMVYGESHAIGVYISIYCGDKWYSDERTWGRSDIC